MRGRRCVLGAEVEALLIAMSAARPAVLRKTLLAADMDPGPSPVSAVDAAFPLETPGQNPAILTIALSPDGNTLYSSLEEKPLLRGIPSAGAGTVHAQSATLAGSRARSCDDPHGG